MSGLPRLICRASSMTNLELREGQDGTPQGSGIWVALSLVVFLLILVVLKVPGMAAKALDDAREFHPHRDRRGAPAAR